MYPLLICDQLTKIILFLLGKSTTLISCGSIFSKKNWNSFNVSQLIKLLLNV